MLFGLHEKFALKPESMDTLEAFPLRPIAPSIRDTDPRKDVMRILPSKSVFAVPMAIEPLAFLSIMPDEMPEKEAFGETTVPDILDLLKTTLPIENERAEPSIITVPLP